ncbi:hypothetical protein CASFOL_016454 [Castilleja foliolosa]|uniref:Pentatricopeptide repeat-containing protein n=1 Tax=Castilleja foliolosa TaxID=1961234 RepID=A0ABD3DKQ1_9LAMI
MRISNQTYTTHQNLFRYYFTFLFSISRKALNPQILHTVVPSFSHRTISSLCTSSSGLSSLIHSESYPIRKISFLINLYSGSSSFFCNKLSAYQKKQSFNSSSPGPISKCYSNPCLSIKNHVSYNSPAWLSSRCKFESYSLYKHQFLCYFSSSNGTIISGPVVESEAHNCLPNFVLEIVDILKENGEDLESRLNTMPSKLPVHSIVEIFEILNTQRISGLRFFEWILVNNPRFRRNANFCSLTINHLGRLDDYETMFVLLKKFTSENICLTYDAFEFLSVSDPTNSSLNENIQRVVDLLNKVGGSCRNSGIHSLIEMFCKLDSFDMAKYVITITESKISYFCILVREKCKNGLIEDAHSIIREMRERHCSPNTTVHNYILGSYWKNGKTDEAFVLLDEMKEFNIPANEITFEILVNFVCSLGNMNDAHKLLDQMSSQGLEPRLTTHARIVKTLFAAEKYEAAHKFVVDSRYKTSSNMMYSLMANLYREKGDVFSARDVLVEMMEKCLKPNFSVYLKIVKRLRKIGKGNLARDLEIRHSKFLIKS